MKEEKVTRRGEAKAILDFWMTEPGARGRAQNALAAIADHMLAKEMIDRQEADLLLGADVGYIRAAAELCAALDRNHEAEDISRSLYWVAASLGDGGSRERLMQVLAQESASPDPRRGPAYLNHLVVRWMNLAAQKDSSGDSSGDFGQDPEGQARVEEMLEDLLESREEDAPTDRGARRSKRTRRLSRREDGTPIVTIESRGKSLSYIDTDYDLPPEGEIHRDLDSVKRELARRNRRARRREGLGDAAGREGVRSFARVADEAAGSGRRSAPAQESLTGLLEDSEEEGSRPGAVVCSAIGDPDGRDGKEIAQRYSRIIGRRLPFRGDVVDPLCFRQEFLGTFPWAESLARYLSGQLSLLRSAGNEVLHFSPLLLVGPPGSGKTRMLEWMSQRIDAEYQTVACGGVSDSGGLGAFSRGWAGARPSAPVQAMATHECANPILILDELDKGSRLGAQNGSLMATLISMLQGGGWYYDACLLASVNIRHVSFLATANDISSLPDPLRDRFVIFQVPKPGEEHFDSILKGIRSKEAERLGVTEELLPWLMPQDIDWLRSAFIRSDFSIRSLEQAYRLILGERANEEMERALRPN